LKLTHYPTGKVVAWKNHTVRRAMSPSDFPARYVPNLLIEHSDITHGIPPRGAGGWATSA